MEKELFSRFYYQQGWQLRFPGPAGRDARNHLGLQCPLVFPKNPKIQAPKSCHQGNKSRGISSQFPSPHPGNPTPGGTDSKQIPGNLGDSNRNEINRGAPLEPIPGPKSRDFLLYLNIPRIADEGINI